MGCNYIHLAVQKWPTPIRETAPETSEPLKGDSCQHRSVCVQDQVRATSSPTGHITSHSSTSLQCNHHWRFPGVSSFPSSGPVVGTQSSQTGVLWVSQKALNSNASLTPFSQFFHWIFLVVVHLLKCLVTYFTYYGP